MANAGDIVVGIPESQLKQASITRVPRVTGVAEGDPELADGRVVSTPNVMWATGFRYDDGWIDLPIFHDRGLLRYDRGVVLEAPGLHCVGLPFLYCETLPWLAASAPMLNTSPRGFATAPAAVVERATRPSCRPSRVRRRVPAARHPYTLVRSLTNLLFRQCLPIYRVLTTSISNATSSFPRSRS